MNNLERAVIAAARAYVAQLFTTDHGRQNHGELEEAVAAYEASLTPGEKEIGWHELAEGDELKSRKNGRFYPVTKVLKVKAGYEITLAGVPNKIVRPNEAEQIGRAHV